MAILKRLGISGFRSIKDAEIELRPLNVLIGANGAGKSNLVAFFKMLNEMMGGRLREFIAGSGRSTSNLFCGPATTPQMSAFLEFETERGLNRYSQRLFHGAGDSLVFADESVTFQATDHPGPGHTVALGVGHDETKIIEAADAGNLTARAVRNLLNQCRVYQFHDTSATARARGYCYRGNDRWLAPDAGNVAAMLYRFRQQEESAAYRRIVATIHQVAPFLGDFELELTGPNARDVILNWRDKTSNNVFGPHQLSDGTLRFISLATLLLQPDELLPDVVVIDEPELGLHPAALNLLAGMLQAASHSCQVIVATQSIALLDAFAPEEIVVVDRRDNASEFHRLSETELRDWLEEYTIGQLWEKNVIGGGPFA